MLEEIQKYLKDTNCRLLTLVGPGGSGKTRLAVAAATMQTAFFADGVFFVPLAGLQSGELVVPAIAQALKFDFRPQGDLRQQLLDYLREKQILLVLDNFEHLLAGAGLVSEILRLASKIWYPPGRPLELL